MKSRSLACVLAFSAALAAAGTSLAATPSVLIKLNLPPDGAVIPGNADTVNFSFTIDSTKLNEKYARFGGLANCEMLIELRLKKAPGGPAGLSDHSSSFHFGPKPKEIDPNANPAAKMPTPSHR